MDKLNKETLTSFLDSQIKANNRLITQKKYEIDENSNIYNIINSKMNIERLEGSVDALSSIKNLITLHGYNMAIRKQNKDKKNTIEIGDIVKSTRDQKVGVVIRIFKSGSIAVLEKISPFCTTTHDNSKTLEIIEKNGIDIFNELEANNE